VVDDDAEQEAAAPVPAELDLEQRLSNTLLQWNNRSRSHTHQLTMK
jgi:hypothetical protein